MFIAAYESGSQKEINTVPDCSDRLRVTKNRSLRSLTSVNTLRADEAGPGLSRSFSSHMVIEIRSQIAQVRSSME